MGPRRITLRSDAQCVVCALPLSARSQAWWDDVARTITCPTCAATQAEAAVDSDTNAGPYARPTRSPALVPEVSRAAGSGTRGQARLSARLRSELAGKAVVLEHRRVPRTKRNIDHLIIAASGVWIVDATHHTGKVVHRDVGSFLRSETRLLVDGRDRTALVTGLDGQVTAVRSALADAGVTLVPVRPVLCFTSSEWGLLTRPFTINGVLVTWSGKLCQRILDGPPAHATEPMHLAAVLSAALPAVA